MIELAKMRRKISKGSNGSCVFRIPKEIQEKLKLKYGDKILVSLNQEGVITLELENKSKNRVVSTDGRNVQVTNLHSESDRLVTG